MVVVAQDFINRLTPHGLHRNAVGEAVLLVGSFLVKVVSFTKASVGQWENPNRGIDPKPVDDASRLPSQNGVMSESREKLVQYLMRGDDLDAA